MIGQTFFPIVLITILLVTFSLEEAAAFSSFSFVPKHCTTTKNPLSRKLFMNADDAELEKAQKLAEQAAALRAEVEAFEEEKAANMPPPPVKEEVIPVVQKVEPQGEISDSMKERLRRELESQGANPNKASGNPILVISALIAILVVAAGGGIFY
mmetsp:Transcript_28417/g.37157  ORF Transcript_28417/g.37157 Transcript_28417/m.37157 type:complete len:155 (+) Transcript_28417:82-546(+)